MRVLVVYAHPYPERSRANRALAKAAEGVDGVSVRSLYALYPDFDIDVAKEQEALAACDTLVWQHPMYWYAMPGLLKHWLDKVLVRGFAYGPGGTALVGKRCLWAVTTGAPVEGFSPEGIHGHPLGAFIPQVEQTARFCGMLWQEPFVVHGAHTVVDAALARRATDYAARLTDLVGAPPVVQRAAGARAAEGV